MKMAVRGELWKKWLQCLSMTVLKQNGSGLMEPVAGCIACKHCQSTGRCCKQDLVNEFLIRQILQTAFCSVRLYILRVLRTAEVLYGSCVYCGDFSGNRLPRVVSRRREEPALHTIRSTNIFRSEICR